MSKEERKCRADKIAFFVCLGVTIGLFIWGFFAPPKGVIDGSVLKAGGIILSFAVVAVGAQALSDGRKAVLKKGDTEITINETK